MATIAIRANYTQGGSGALGTPPGATSPLSLTDGAGITLSNITSSGCTINYTIPPATLLAISSATYIYDLLVDYTDGSTDCVIGESEVLHQQVMTQ